LDPMFKDSIARRCGGSMEETRSFMVTSCSPIVISSIEIEGVDKNSYQLLDAPTGAVSGQGSIRVAFAPGHSGHHEAQLVVRLADGTTRTIDLAGMADLEEQELLVKIADFDLDTIGGSAQIELTLGPADDDIAAKVSFDPALEFDGVYSWNGTPISASASAGKVRFVVPKLALRAEGADVILQFKNVMAIPRLEYLISVDSAAVVGVDPECVRTQALPSSSIKVAGGCAAELYSHLLRDESITFRITQDESGDALFVSSEHTGKVRFSLYDLMGHLVTDLELDLLADRPVRLILPGRLQGTYFALLRNNVTFKNHKLQLGIGY
jgi:hypothetical protein